MGSSTIQKQLLANEPNIEFKDYYKTISPAFVFVFWILIDCALVIFQYQLHKVKSVTNTVLAQSTFVNWVVRNMYEYFLYYLLIGLTACILQNNSMYKMSRPHYLTTPYSGYLN